MTDREPDRSSDRIAPDPPSSGRNRRPFDDGADQRPIDGGAERGPTPPAPEDDPRRPPSRMTLKGAPVLVALLVAFIAIEALQWVGGRALRLQFFIDYAFFPLTLTHSIPKPEGGSIDMLPGLLTHMALHGGVAHLAFNGLALLAIGPPVERAFGSARFLVFFVVAGVAGALGHYAWEAIESEATGGAPALSGLVGASGAICGVLGADLRLKAAALGRMPREIRPQSPQSFLFGASIAFVVVNVLIGVIDVPISGAAHLGGFAFGLLAGAAFAPSRAG